MKSPKQHVAFNWLSCLFVVVPLLTISCREDEASIPIVKFSAENDSLTESEGIIEINVELNHAAHADIEISFIVGGTAFLNGDYRLLTPSPILVPEGSDNYGIKVEIIDEDIIEPESDDLKIVLTESGTSGILSQNSEELEYHLTIQDNDEVPSDELQFDLTWSLGDGADIDEVNLELYLANHVVIDEDGDVEDFTLYRASERTSGFETISIRADDPDDEYYVVVYFKEGDAMADFSLTVNGMGHEDEIIQDVLNTSDVGFALFLGPVNKAGSSIGRVKAFMPLRARRI